MRVALIRHPAVAIAPGVCYGRLDVALSAAGMAAIPGIVAAVVGLAGACVWTSPARRCVAVAEAIGGTVRRDDRLLELDFGDWEGVPWDDVPRTALDAWAASPEVFAAPGGESVAALVARVRGFFEVLRGDGRDGVVVTHGGVLKVLRPLLREAAVDLGAAAPELGSVDVVSGIF
jgi:alpha-ribazole phosphatase